MKRRLISACVSGVLLTSLLLTSCLSSEQKQIANEKESVSKTIAEEYLKSNYDGGTIKNLKCLTYTPKDSALRIPKASSYVRASANTNDKDFYILIDTDSKKCLDNYNVPAVKDEIAELASNLLAGDPPENISVGIIPKSVPDTLNLGDYEGYLENGAKSLDDIMSDGGYSIDVIAQYYDSHADFSSIDTSEFFKRNTGENDMNLTYINYRDKEHLDVAPDDGGFSYRVNAMFSSTYSGDPDSPENVYVKFEHRELDDAEVVWDSTRLALEFSETEPEEDISSEKYKNHTFSPVGDSSVLINYEKLVDDDEPVSIDLYFYPKNSGNYGVMTDNLNPYNRNTVWQLNKSNNEPIYEEFSFDHYAGNLVLGMYTASENNIADIVGGLSGQK